MTREARSLAWAFGALIPMALAIVTCLNLDPSKAPKGAGAGVFSYVLLSYACIIASARAERA